MSRIVIDNFVGGPVEKQLMQKDNLPYNNWMYMEMWREKARGLKVQYLRV